MLVSAGSTRVPLDRASITTGLELNSAQHVVCRYLIRDVHVATCDVRTSPVRASAGWLAPWWESRLCCGSPSREPRVRIVMIVLWKLKIYCA